MLSRSVQLNQKLAQKGRFVYFVLAKLSLIFIVVTAPMLRHSMHAQSPGGFNSGLTHWYRAEGCLCSGVCASGNTVTSISPSIGGTSATISASGTTYTTGVFNFNPTISLSNGQFRFPRGGVPGDFSAFVVTKSASNVAAASATSWRTDPWILGGDDNSNFNDFALVWDDGKIRYAHEAGNQNYAYSSNSLNFRTGPQVLISAIRNQNNSGNDSLGLFFDGTWTVGTGSRNTDNDDNTFTNFYVGQNQPGSGAFYNGEVGEVIIYDNNITGLERQHVESYLALKYGITLGHPYRELHSTNSNVIYSSTGGFGFDVVGVGKATGSNFDQRVSASTTDPGFVVINGPAPGSFTGLLNSSPLPTAPTNNTYLTIGNDNGSNIFNRFFNGGLKKLGATYKVVDVGYGQVTLLFKKSSFPDLVAPGTTNYYLAYGKDPDLGYGETYLALTNVTGSPDDYYVTLDFPADTSYFTLTTTNTFKGPGNVVAGLELWVSPDTMAAGAPGSIVGWRDLSENGHDIVPTALNGNYVAAPAHLNFHAIVHGGALDQSWRTVGSFCGQTIVGVGKVSGGQNNDGWMGFNNGVGLRKTTGAADEKLGVGASDWTTGGILRQNGLVNTTPSLTNFSMILAEKSAQNARSRFFVGGYVAGQGFTTYDFGEIIVYDRALTTPEKEQLESYLAIKYGLTLTSTAKYYASDRVSGASTVVYDPITYGNEVCGFGRDDNSTLQQRQAQSASVQAVLSMSLEAETAYDSLNLASFGGDKCYLVAGHDNGNVTCWTSDEINVTGQEGEHVRLQREWKVQKTGAGWGTTQYFEFTIQSANVNLPLPALPTGSPRYYMYLNTGGDFDAGTTIARPMITNGTRHTVRIRADSIPNLGYITFGTRLNTTQRIRSTCPGTGLRIVIQRSHIAELGSVCSFVQLSGTSGSNFNFKPGGTATDTTYTVVNNLVGPTCLDSLILIVPNIVGSDDYVVKFDTLLNPPACGPALTHVFTNVPDALVDSLIVTPADIAAITWGLPADSVFCVGSPNRVAAMNGSDSGTFSFVSSSNVLVTNISQLIPNNVYGSSGFGTILVHPGILGTHTIKYTTNAAPACTTSQTFKFRIASTTSTSFNYVGSPYCNGAGVQMPSSFVGPTGGQYSVFPPINPLALNTLNGAIDVNLIASPGNYVVTYTPLANSCASTSSASITVAAALQANFQYLDSSFCSGTGTIAPFVTNRPSSGYFTIAGTSPTPLGSIDLDSTNGFIDLDSTAAGIYHVQYFVDTTACHKDTYDTITVHATPNTAFTVSAPYFDTLCTGGGMVKLLPTVGGGTFKNYDGHFIVSTLGAQDSIRAVGAAGGPFTMYYVRTDPFCTDSTARLIYVRGPQSAVITYPGTVFCKNQPAQSPTFVSGSAGGTFISLPSMGAGLDINSGVITPSVCATGTYAISYKTADPVCFTTIPIGSVTISNPPNAHFNLIQSTVCQDSGRLLIDTIPSGMTNSFTVWSGGQLVPGAIVNNDSVVTTALQPGLTYEIRNIGTIATCKDTAYDYLTTIARDSANIEFIPSIICVGDNDPHPYNFGLGGGIFSSLSGHIVDPDSGIVTVGTTLDTFIVQYLTPGVCFSRDTSKLIIAPFLSAGFDYGLYSWCISDTTHPTPTVNNANLGTFTFTSTPPGLWLEIDSTTGRISLDSSQAGRFDIRYTIDQTGSCRADTVRSFTIVAHDVTSSFTLDPGPHCPSRGVLKPIFTPGSDLSGIFVSDPDLVFAVVDSGYISLPQSVEGQHIILYTLPGECADVLQDTITILLTDTSSFMYGTFQTAFCNDQLNVLPTLQAPSVPDSFAIPTSINPTFPPPYIDPYTGELDFKINNSLGNYTVYHYTQGICPDTSVLQITISNIPTGTGLRAVPQDTICVGESVEIKASGVAAEFVYYRGNSPDTVSVGADHIFDDIVDYDTIRVTFRTSFGCQIADTIYIVANPVPAATLLPYPEIISGDVPFDLSLRSLSDQTSFSWSLDSLLGSVDFPEKSGKTALVDSNEIMVISQLPHLLSDINPASFLYIITPFAKGCRGEEMRIRVKVNPNGNDIFIPQVFTPNGNGLNEMWQIQWRDGILPENYTIKLYNEAGALVYTMNPLKSDWNGEGLADGVYWYILFDNTGEAKEAAGLTIRSK